MYNMLKLELKNCLRRKEFKIIFTIIMAGVLMHFINEWHELLIKDLTNVLGGYDHTVLQSVFPNPLLISIGSLMPLTCSLIYSDSYYTDIKNGIYKNIVTRTNRFNYVLSKIIITFTVSFLIIFIPLIIDQILCYMCFPFRGHMNYFGDPSYIYINTIYPDVQLHYMSIFHPYINNFIYILINSLFGGLLALLSLSISFVIKKNKYIIVLSSFIIFEIYKFISEILPDIIEYLFNKSIDISIVNGVLHPNNTTSKILLPCSVFVIVLVSTLLIYYGYKKDFNLE
ncbi:hypothetical protein [Clostridium novyi]|uniref:Uncharacterized protein n=3 Tax=Clostridium TaxID=1485 RepID=A0AA40IRE4_CLONO|nr:hypothetical protein [Clostridium novyi]KEI07993.1 hypothetical protein Z958_p0184 [Clostridium novyi B str. NCTC 9691]KEI11379.1 hypothetical protein Z959_p0077 [Clostridium novyi B str. ATCC 27606]